MTITLLQWNVWFKEKPDNIVDYIKEVNPDIVCLQELTQGLPEHNYLNIPRYITEKLEYYSCFHPAHRWINEQKQEETIGSGIFSRYPITTCKQVVIHQPPPFPTDVYTEQIRVYIESEIDFGNEKTLEVGTVHLSYTDKFQLMPHQQKETEKVIEIIREKKEKYILTGDLNAIPPSYVVTEINKYLTHLGPPLEEKTWTTKPIKHPNFQADGLNWRLDYVFGTSDIKVISAKTLETQISDHLPILIEIEV